MISRRLLRIKVLKILYANLQSEDKPQIATEKELMFSIKKTYDLYHLTLLLLTDIAHYAQIRIDIGKQKHLPTPEEKNPNTRFVDNAVIKLLNENRALKSYVNQEKLSWNDNRDLIKKLFLKISESEYYQSYMNKSEHSFADDCNVVCEILKTELEDFDDIYNYLEEKNIYWTDDFEFVLSMAIKTIRRFKENQSEDVKLMPLYKDESDQKFGVRLLRRAIFDYDKNKTIIDQNTKNWDLDRIAFMDIVILQMAIAEASEFHEIPIRVTIDEYLEISKYFSSPTSKVFINGILDKVLNKMIADKTIVKQGLGLVNNNKETTIKKHKE